MKAFLDLSNLDNHYNAQVCVQCLYSLYPSLHKSRPTRPGRGQAQDQRFYALSKAESVPNIANYLKFSKSINVVGHSKKAESSAYLFSIIYLKEIKIIICLLIIIMINLKLRYLLNFFNCKYKS